MRYRGYYSDDELDFILCTECGDEFQWLTSRDRPWDVEEWNLGETEFRLPCGHVETLFEDVIPLRGQLA